MCLPGPATATLCTANAGEPKVHCHSQACGCDVGACGFAIDVAFGFDDLGFALAGGDLARVDVAGQTEQVLSQAGRVGLVPTRPVFGRQGDEQPS